MGIDYCACYADVMEWSDIREIAPQAAADFVAVLEKYRGDEAVDYLLEQLARSVNEDLYGDLASREIPHQLLSCLDCSPDVKNVALQAQEILNSFRELCEEFRRKTMVQGAGLELGIGYHDSHNQGCRGDEIDGVYYYIRDGAWQLTPAGKRFGSKFERKHFTAWG